MVLVWFSNGHSHNSILLPSASQQVGITLLDSATKRSCPSHVAFGMRAAQQIFIAWETCKIHVNMRNYAYMAGMIPKEPALVESKAWHQCQWFRGTCGNAWHQFGGPASKKKSVENATHIAGTWLLSFMLFGMDVALRETERSFFPDCAHTSFSHNVLVRSSATTFGLPFFPYALLFSTSPKPVSPQTSRSCKEVTMLEPSSGLSFPLTVDTRNRSLGPLSPTTRAQRFFKV